MFLIKYTTKKNRYKPINPRDPFKVEVYAKLFFAQKIEKYMKLNTKRPKGFFTLRIFYKFSRFFKTLKYHVSEKKSKMYTEESV